MIKASQQKSFFPKSKKNNLIVQNKDLYRNCEIGYREISNLIRLGLISEEMKIISSAGDFDEDGNWNQNIDTEPKDEYYLTSFGYEFIEACKIE